MYALRKKLKRHNPFISRSFLYLSGFSYMDIRRMRIERLTPNLLVIGAQKSGTTSLHKYLNLHPDIFMSSPVKEPGFFLDFSIFKEYLLKYKIFVKSPAGLLKNYMLQGYTGQRYIGESSTYYTIGDRCTQHNVPANIANTKKNIRFIYILRNPFSRIVSNYLHESRKGRARVDLDEYVLNTQNSNPDHTCLKTSLYYNQLSEYLKWFDKSQFLLTIFEDFIEDPEKSLNRIFSFLSIPEISHFPSFKVFNSSSNRKNHSDRDLKFSGPVYAHLLDLFETQKAGLESFMEQPIRQWDFSKDKWCKS